jgi:tetratricopeptide (TPR) repeat protein
MRASVCTLVAIFGIVRPLAADMVCHRADQACATQISRYQLATQIAPGFALYWTKLAAAAQAIAEHPQSQNDRIELLKEARRAAEHAVCLMPADPNNHANLGRAAAALTAAATENDQVAFAAFDRAIASAPNNPIIRCDAGRAAFACARLALARQYFDFGLRLHPQFGCFAAGLGMVALAEGRASEAISLLEQADRGQWPGGGREKLPAMLAAACLATGRNADAEHQARKAVEQQPDDIAAHWLLAGALELEGQPIAATQEIQTILSLTPQWPPALAALQRLQQASPSQASHLP